ncbi:MAG: CBS and ACT domain-containing protein [Defluviitaleaceae bacterium]|nr:CBS and ACT domain-containing protein [Defluviitaleaceae bacterium]MCL2263213.1 CBS and ACT domain-containing protein [Defluviitaleaceae bacterium]
MLISEMMTTDVATVTEDASLSKAFQILHDRKHKVLPVVREDKLVGLLSEKLLAEVKPSKSTTLSVYELNYLMTRTKVKDVMLKLKDVHFTNPAALVEDAALVMYSLDIGSLPVVEDDKTVVGIITQTDIFKAFISLMGVDHKGTRLSLDIPNNTGMVAKISKIVTDADINISNINNLDRGNGRHDMVLRIDTKDTADLVAALEEADVKVSDVRVFE